MLAAASVVLWALTGPLFGWSDTWQLICNTATTIVTFLMVFLIQSTQSRDTQAMHLKLDELIRVTGPARNRIILAEEAEQADLEAMRTELQDAARNE
jgi:low affinity Fe/Cu permease